MVFASPGIARDGHGPNGKSDVKADTAPSAARQFAALAEFLLGSTVLLVTIIPLGDWLLVEHRQSELPTAVISAALVLGSSLVAAAARVWRRHRLQWLAHAIAIVALLAAALVVGSQLPA